MSPSRTLKLLLSPCISTCPCITLAWLFPFTVSLMRSLANTYLLSKFLVFRFKTLAVATPGCIKLNENILALIIYKGIKVLSHNNLKTMIQVNAEVKKGKQFDKARNVITCTHLDWAIVALRNRLRFQVPLQISIKVILKEFLQSFPITAALNICNAWLIYWLTLCSKKRSVRSFHKVLKGKEGQSHCN